MLKRFLSALNHGATMLTSIRTAIGSHCEPGTSLLAYFSSGEPQVAFQDLPFDRIIAVDRSHRGPGRSRVWRDGKVLYLGMENDEAAVAMTSLGLTLDTLLALNDGCGEGGNRSCQYDLSGLGRLLPLLRTGTQVFIDHDHGFEHAPLRVTPMPVPEWVEGVRGSSPMGCVRAWTLEENRRPGVDLPGRSVDVHIRHDSVFSHLPRVDALLATERTLHQFNVQSYLQALKPVHRLEVFPLPPRPTPSILDAVRAALEAGCLHLGVLPSFSTHSPSVVEELCEAVLIPGERSARAIQGIRPKVTFFHMDDRDFRWARRPGFPG